MMHGADHSLFFCHNLSADGYAFGLYPNTNHGETFFQDTELRPLASQRFLLLFAVPDSEPKKALYTTNPRSGVGLNEVEEESVYRVFRLDGSYVTTAEEAELRALPRGIYIIRSARSAQKRIVQ